MKMRYFDQRKVRIEIIPMIDIMFFLLVFFVMITLQMIPDRGVNLQLPHSSTTQTLPHSKVLINLKTDGEIVVEGKTVTISDLQTQLTKNNPTQTQVIIAGAKDASLQHLTDVMDVCRQAGVTDISIAADPSPSK